MKSKQHDFQKGDVFRNPLLMKVEVLEVLRKNLLVVEVQDYNNPEDGNYNGLMSKQMIKDNDLKFIGHVDYIPRKFFKFLGPKKVFIPA